MAGSDFIVGTDVAHLVLFHPDDLQHRSNDPIAWYAYDFVYEKESRAGKLIAWCTGSDGGFGIRFAQDGLTPAEAAAACMPWTFPYVVRHGRVLVDNTDALPGQEQMTHPEDLDSWHEIENGTYQVTITPIDRGEDESDALPDYVIAFEPVASLAWVPAAPTPPDLRPYKEWTPKPTLSFEGEGAFSWPERAIETNGLPLVVVDPDMIALPRVASTFAVEEPIAKLAFHDNRNDRFDVFVMTDKDAVGQLGVLAQRSGLSQQPGHLPRLSLHGAAIGRILALEPGDVVPLATMEVLAKPDMAVPKAAIDAFRAALTAAAETKRIKASSFELERLASFTSAEAMTSWALGLVGMPLGMRLETYALDAKGRIKAIGEALG